MNTASLILVITSVLLEVILGVFDTRKPTRGWKLHENKQNYLNLIPLIHEFWPLVHNHIIFQIYRFLQFFPCRQSHLGRCVMESVYTKAKAIEICICMCHHSIFFCLAWGLHNYGHHFIKRVFWSLSKIDMLTLRKPSATIFWLHFQTVKDFCGVWQSVETISKDFGHFQWLW